MVTRIDNLPVIFWLYQADTMANGGWYGTDEEWRRIEAPLLAVDPTISSFAEDHKLALSKTTKTGPSALCGGQPTLNA